MQRQRLDTLVGHAKAHSPFYRRLYQGLDGRGSDVASLPPVTKAQLMESFDDWVTDRRLRLADLERHLDHLIGDELYLGRYRLMASSGSTGRRGVFAYSRADWRVNLANFARINEQLLDVHPRLPPRLRAGTVAATSPLHISARTSLTTSVGVNRVLRLDARQPLPELVAALQTFQPELLVGFPSVLALLAEEQRAGRLELRPTTLATSRRCARPRWSRPSAQPGAWIRSTGTGSPRGACWRATVPVTRGCTCSRTSSWSKT